MSQKPYDYKQRKDIHPISWEDFHGLCKGLALAVAPFAPEIILAVGRGGYYPGTLISHLLRVEIYPVRVSRRVRDVVKFDTPEWFLEPTPAVAGRRVLIVDEICDTGETITLVKEKVEGMGAEQVKSAVLYAHTWGASVPDTIGVITDALILNPWDREIYAQGTFVFHPEYVGALEKQGITPDASLRIDAPVLAIAKSE